MKIKLNKLKINLGKKIKLKQKKQAPKKSRGTKYV